MEKRSVTSVFPPKLFGNSGSASFRQRLKGPAIFGGILLLFLAVAAYGLWLLQLERGARAAARGDLETAARIYNTAERSVPWFVARVFPDHYARPIFAQVALLYNTGKTDDAAGKLERGAVIVPSLAERPEYGFWSGNVLLRRAVENLDPEVSAKHLFAAGAQYRKALEASPDDWDIKYNYELVQYLLAQNQKDREKEESKMKSILERIRTVTEPAPKEPPPPEKRG